MFALWMFGSTLENLWGPKRFLLFYLLCGIGAAFVHMLAMGYDLSKLELLFSQGQVSPEIFYGNLNVPTLGASGAVMGIFAAFAFTFPNSQLFILPIPFPIKAKWALLTGGAGSVWWILERSNRHRPFRAYWRCHCGDYPGHDLEQKKPADVLLRSVGISGEFL
jgi:membrane associated rhomboid family serine protease